MITAIDNKKDFSIVVCCYFGEKTIVECFNSLLNQNYPKNNYEIIIVDDGSIDNSTNVIKNFISHLSHLEKPLIKYYRTRNSGLSKARNFGIDKASGQYVLFIDEDAIACEGWLLEYSSTIHDNNYPDVVYGLVTPFPNANWFEKFITSTFYDKLDSKGTHIPVLIGTNMGFKKELFSNGFGFFDDYSYRGDETIFILSLGVHYTEAWNKNAFVCHENPNQMIKWLKERMQNGFAEYLIDIFKVKYLGLGKYSFTFKKTFFKLFFVVLIGFLAYKIQPIQISPVLLLLIPLIKSKDIKHRMNHLKLIGYKNPLLLSLLSIFIRAIGFLAKEVGYLKVLFKNDSFSYKRGGYSEEILEKIIVGK